MSRAFIIQSSDRLRRSSSVLGNRVRPGRITRRIKCSVQIDVVRATCLLGGLASSPRYARLRTGINVSLATRILSLILHHQPYRAVRDKSSKKSRSDNYETFHDESVSASAALKMIPPRGGERMATVSSVDKKISRRHAKLRFSLLS